MPEEIDELENKKGKKEKKKKEKKPKKEKNTEPEVEEPESVGSKILMAVITIIIFLIWLGIFGVLIKFDVGGFGSTVLYPIIKDVPVLNKILPDVVIDEEDSRYAFDSLDEAIEALKALERENAELAAKVNEYELTISDLNGDVEGLTKYKEEQAKFEKDKEKFYEEVVFSDSAPDIKEYRYFYESIDPANAEVLYKQVVEQIEEDEQVKEYAKRYSSMKPANAAAIFNTMTDDLALVARILKNMSVQSSSDILAAMNADTAAKLTEIMEP